MKLPKLHLRDLFWLIALVAMGCAWWGDRRRAATDASREVEVWQTAAKTVLRHGDADVLYTQYLSMKGEGPPAIPLDSPGPIRGVHVLKAVKEKPQAD